MQSRAVHNWLLRFCALIVFVSGGALAQRLAKEIDTQLILLEFPREKHNKAVTLELRQPEPVQLQSAVGPTRALAVVANCSSQPQFLLVERAIDPADLRTFDALAPPQR
jgi:hypothetical protein